MKKPNLFCVICIFLILVGCRDPATQPALSQQEVDFQALVSFQVSPNLILSPEGNNQIHIHDTKNIYLKNLYSECVVFPYDHGVSIWFYKNGRWTRLKNLMVVLDPHDIILKPKGEMFSERGFSIFPDYDVVLSEKPSSIRVVIAGRLCENGNPTETIVGNYIDIQVVP